MTRTLVRAPAPLSTDLLTLAHAPARRHAITDHAQ